MSNEHIAVNADFLSAAWARKWNTWGVAYSNTQHLQAEAFFSAETLGLLVQGGAPQWTTWFDAFVTASGDTVPNTEGLLLKICWGFIGGLNFDGDAILSQILADTRIGFSWHRSHCIGLSKAWRLGILQASYRRFWPAVAGQRLHFSIQNTEDGLDAFGAFSNGLNVASIAALSGGIPTEFEQLRMWGPVGQGWALDFGAVVEWENKAWASASLTDIGTMEWRGEQYSLNTLFSEWATPVTDPTNILDVVIGAMDPNTWFDEPNTKRDRFPMALHSNWVAD